MESQINFKVTLDENHIPEKIDWEATDGGDKSECKAAMISIWDSNELNTLKIDLWTKDMLVDEMKQFYHQTLLSMADSFGKATGEDKMADSLKDFCHYFAENLDLIEQK